MTSVAFVFVVVGILVMAAAWLPVITRDVPLTLPIFCVAISIAGAAVLGIGHVSIEYARLAEDLTSIALIVGVAGTGLRIDRRFGWRAWASAWRLLVVVMPLSIAAIAAIARGVLGLDTGEAILLGAILAPTDPVLAANVQLGPPGIGEEGEARFALTAEAGLNDGLALPFVLLGMQLGSHEPGALWRWLVFDLVVQIAIGAAIGIAFAWLLVRWNRLLPERLRVARAGEGILVLAIGFLAFGLATLAHGNGFVAVFAAVVTMRNVGEEVEYYRKLSDAADQFERLAMVLILAMFGAALEGGLLRYLQPIDAVLTVLALFAIRPLATLVGFWRSPHPTATRLAAGFLGVRGLASLYYMAYAAREGELAHVGRLWSIVALTVLASIALFGVSDQRVMRHLDRLREEQERGGA